jgi:hypothetical protein
MREHERTPHVSVKVFIDEEEVYDFPPDLSRDFTLIDDGRVIGITTTYGLDKLEAAWHFNDRTKARVLREIRDQLIKSSRSLTDLEQQLNSNRQ